MVARGGFNKYIKLFFFLTFIAIQIGGCSKDQNLSFHKANSSPDGIIRYAFAALKEGDQTKFCIAADRGSSLESEYCGVDNYNAFLDLSKFAKEGTIKKDSLTDEEKKLISSSLSFTIERKVFIKKSHFFISVEIGCGTPPQESFPKKSCRIRSIKRNL